MKLTVGSTKLGPEFSDTVQLSDGGDIVQQLPPSEMLQPRLGRVSPYLLKIDEVVVGFVDLKDIDFLELLPNVTSVWILTPTVKDIQGLRYLAHIESLAIDRPTCRMDVLGELGSLKELYIDDWRPGAHSIFRLRNLTKVGIQKFGHPDLSGMSNWLSLNELWINAGKLEDLSGIPTSIRRLRLTTLKKLESLRPLSVCHQLEELLLDCCRGVASLNGLDHCLRLKLLSIARGGNIESLEPIKNLRRLEYVFLAGGTKVQSSSISALYSLPNLAKLIIAKQSGLEKDKVLEAAPNCEIILAG